MNIRVNNTAALNAAIRQFVVQSMEGYGTLRVRNISATKVEFYAVDKCAKCGCDCALPNWPVTIEYTETCRRKFAAGAVSTIIPHESVPEMCPNDLCSNCYTGEE